jgi:hypothetical protein
LAASRTGEGIDGIALDLTLVQKAQAETRYLLLAKRSIVADKAATKKVLCGSTPVDVEFHGCFYLIICQLISEVSKPVICAAVSP